MRRRHNEGGLLILPNQDDFPEKWACDSPNKKARVEIRVPATTTIGGRQVVAEGEGSWIEIPTQSVEQYVAKGEAARIQRSTKVVFPTEWGRDEAVLTTSPTEIITQFTEDQSQPFTWARVSYRDQRADDADWVVTQIGWIGGMGPGPASDPGTSKMWVYDPAELMSGTAVGATLKNPTVQQAVEKVARLVNDNTPIPLGEVEIVPPSTEEEFSEVAEEIEEFDLFGTRRGLGESQLVYQYPTTTGGQAGEVGPVEDGENYTSAVVNTGTSEGDQVFDLRFNDAKTFRSNKHTLQEVFDYVEGKTGAKMHFEPQPEGHAVRLVVDVVPERRTFSQDEVARRKSQQVVDGVLEPRGYSLYKTVSVMKNNALYEMKPINTLRMDGETGAGVLDPVADWIDRTTGGELLGSNPPSNQYPYVKLQVPSLLQAAEGQELGPREESSATTESDLIEEAKKRLREILEEPSEGEVFIKGVPEILPFDRLDSFEVCNDIIIYEQDPVRYEVEEVKHTATASDIYKTRLLVSVWANEENIEVVESGMADLATSEEEN